MLVFVAHSGKTLELQAQPATRIEHVQQALAARTDIASSEQILMYNGLALDPVKPLSAYLLPADGSNKSGDVFLYAKSHLRPGSALPPTEVLRSFSIHVSSPPITSYEPHTLDAAPSSLIRQLPDFERKFRQHLSRAQALWEISQARHRACLQLVGEMEVQGRAVDAARSNIEQHYSFIQNAYVNFTNKFAAQRAKHDEVLARFPSDLDLLAGIELLPAARSRDVKRLIDLIPEQQMRSWYEACRTAHRHLLEKVSEQEVLWSSLKGDVEALLLQAPTVALDALAHQLSAHQAAVTEQAAIVQVLQADHAQVERLGTAAVHELTGVSLSGSAGTPLDKCQLLEAMHDNHASQLLPRVEACEAGLAAFCQRCIDDKNTMTRDVVGQLRRISGQQSKIRALRNKLALLGEAVSKQETSFVELTLITRIPAAYRQTLAECMRREAFAEIYAGQASQMAECMGKLRRKETKKRIDFLKSVERLLPEQMLASLGLMEEPPHCQVSLPAPPSALPHVTLQDVRRIQLPADSQGQASSIQSQTQSGPLAASGSTSQPPSASQQDDTAAGEAETSEGESLEMQNAWLRAELASHIAREAARAAAARPSLDDSHPPPVSPRHGSSQQASAAGAAREAAGKFHTALAAKEDLLRRQQDALASSRLLTASYEGRIRGLEQRLASMSLASMTPAEPLVTSASYAEPAQQASGTSMQPGSPLARTLSRDKSGSGPGL